MPYHSRATAKLLPGRISHAGASYFLTWGTYNRRPGLSAPAVLATLRTAIFNLDRSRDTVLLAATVMPEHVHLLITLGTRLTVSQVVAKIKATVTRRIPQCVGSSIFSSIGCVITLPQRISPSISS